VPPDEKLESRLVGFAKETLQKLGVRHAAIRKGAQRWLQGAENVGKGPVGHGVFTLSTSSALLEAAQPRLVFTFLLLAY
jgi:hypothetical protein